MFITKSEGYSGSTVKFLGVLQIAVDMHYGTYCKIKQSIEDVKGESSELQTYISICFDPAK